MDIAIVVDNSESVHEVEAKETLLNEFVKGIINDANVESGNVRFAFSVFTHDIYNEFFLNSYYDKVAMIAHVDTSSHPQGGSYTGAALENLHSLVFTSAKGDRAIAPNLAIIVTDGKSNDEHDTLLHATQAKEKGIHIVAVGVGLTDTSELFEIASEPVANNVFTVNGYEDLFSIMELIEDLFYENCTGNHLTLHTWTLYLHSYVVYLVVLRRFIINCVMA